ncbi:FAD/NAD-P-binding domain-containing protein [Cubamyces sp. BRFM 1775]|nr:FAD/NAD-P-binding domain-containing protein [Cubamyces sp. BRFM 1775]
MEIPSTLVEEFQRLNENRRSICVIGAGPAGLAAVKIIKDSQHHKDGLWTVTAFEARDEIGGIWLPAPAIGDPPLTPLYDSLTTNLPHPVMAYTSFSFPPSTPLFPPASTVLEYMKAYAAHFELTPHIRLNTPVLSTTRDSISGKWTVTVRFAQANSDETITFDHLIVANGHYRIPRFPNTPGLNAWLEAKKAFHAVYYRNPADFGDARTVLVVGAGPSGQDLCTDLLASGRTVVHSVTGAVREYMRDSRLKIRGRVAKYLDPQDGKVVFEDGSEESGIGCAVLATGYKIDFPFLGPDIVRQAVPPPVPPLPRALYNSTYHVFPLARHIFPLVDADELPASSIAFIGLPVRVAPLPLLEAQMRAVLHVFAQPDALDPTQEAIDIISRYEALRAQISARRPPSSPGAGTGTSAASSNAPLSQADGTPLEAEGDSLELAIARAWHRFDGHEQFEYRDALHAFAGHPTRVPAWEVEMYDAKGVLREEWRDLERSGLAEEWVRGVGEAGGEEGIQQWVELMRRLLKRAEERHPERSRL